MSSLHCTPLADPAGIRLLLVYTQRASLYVIRKPADQHRDGTSESAATRDKQTGSETDASALLRAEEEEEEKENEEEDEETGVRDQGAQKSGRKAKGNQGGATLICSYEFAHPVVQVACTSSLLCVLTSAGESKH